MAGRSQLCPQHSDERAPAPADSARGNAGRAVAVSQPPVPSCHQPKRAAGRWGAGRPRGRLASPRVRRTAPRPRGSQRRRLCLPSAPPAASTRLGVHETRSCCAKKKILKRKNRKKNEGKTSPQKKSHTKFPKSVFTASKLPTKRFRDSSISADATLAFILPLTDFNNKSLLPLTYRRSCGQ